MRFRTVRNLTACDDAAETALSNESIILFYQNRLGIE